MALVRIEAIIDEAERSTRRVLSGCLFPLDGPAHCRPQKPDRPGL
jgi:hypothetical protein